MQSRILEVFKRQNSRSPEGLGDLEAFREISRELLQGNGVDPTYLDDCLEHLTTASSATIIMVASIMGGYLVLKTTELKIYSVTLYSTLYDRFKTILGPRSVESCFTCRRTDVQHLRVLWWGKPRPCCSHSPARPTVLEVNDDIIYKSREFIDLMEKYKSHWNIHEEYVDLASYLAIIKWSCIHGIIAVADSH